MYSREYKNHHSLANALVTSEWSISPEMNSKIEDAVMRLRWDYSEWLWGPISVTHIRKLSPYKITRHYYSCQMSKFWCDTLILLVISSPKHVYQILLRGDQWMQYVRNILKKKKKKTKRKKQIKPSNQGNMTWKLIARAW